MRWTHWLLGLWIVGAAAYIGYVLLITAAFGGGITTMGDGIFFAELGIGPPLAILVLIYLAIRLARRRNHE